MSLLSKLQAVQVESKRTIETVTLTVTGIISMKPTDKSPKDKDGNVIPKSQILTNEAGSLFCFSSVIANKPESFALGAKAQVVLEEKSYTDKDGKEATAINIIRVDFLKDDDLFRGAATYGTTISR